MADHHVEALHAALATLKETMIPKPVAMSPKVLAAAIPPAPVSEESEEVVAVATPFEVFESDSVDDEILPDLGFGGVIPEMETFSPADIESLKKQKFAELDAEHDLDVSSAPTSEPVTSEANPEAVGDIDVPPPDDSDHLVKDGSAPVELSKSLVIQMAQVAGTPKVEIAPVPEEPPTDTPPPVDEVEDFLPPPVDDDEVEDFVPPPPVNDVLDALAFVPPPPPPSPPESTPEPVPTVSISKVPAQQMPVWPLSPPPDIPGSLWPPLLAQPTVVPEPPPLPPPSKPVPIVMIPVAPPTPAVPVPPPPPYVSSPGHPMPAPPPKQASFFPNQKFHAVPKMSDEKKEQRLLEAALSIPIEEMTAQDRVNSCLALLRDARKGNDTFRMLSFVIQMGIIGLLVLLLAIGGWSYGLLKKQIAATNDHINLVEKRLPPGWRMNCKLADVDKDWAVGCFPDPVDGWNPAPPSAPAKPTVPMTQFEDTHPR